MLNFRFPELSAGKRSWWLIVEETGEVDLCLTDPGFDVDLYVETDLRTMTAIWMGLTTVAQAADKLALAGPKAVAGAMQSWLGLSPFAKERKLAY